MRIRTFKIRPRARVRLFFGEKQMITSAGKDYESCVATE